MIRKRPDGRWEGRIVAGHKENGNPIFRSVFAKTQKELLHKLHRNIDLYQDVELNEMSRMTLSEWLDIWLTEHAAHRVRPSTLKGYEQYANSYIKPILGSKQISSITTADVQRMYSKLKKEGRIHVHKEHGKSLSDSMVSSIHRMLHSALKTAQQEHVIIRNPTLGTVVPKATRKEKQILTRDEVDLFLCALEGDPYWYALFYTELTTGLRRGELCGLRWEDLDIPQQTLHIQRTVHLEKGGKATTGATKTGRGTRKIILPKSTVTLLEHRKETSTSQWIFPNLLNPEQPLSPPVAYRKLKQILQENNLPDVSYHSLRHFFATHALTNGVDAKTLSGILGHTNASFTLDTYTHVTADMQQQAANIVGSFLDDFLGDELQYA